MDPWNQILRRSLCILAAMCLAFPARSIGQAAFEEDFENIGTVPAGQQGPSGLIQNGWVFRNQSSPATNWPAWTPNGGSGWSNTGDGYLRSSTSSAGFIGASLSTWAILPIIPGQQAGDVLSIWVLDGNFPNLDTFLDVRYSPGGGTGTGSGPLDIGDFTEVLFTDELPVGDGPAIYTQVQVTLPGPGRIAMRYHAPNVHSVGGVTSNLYIDTLTVGAPPDQPCGLNMPAVGQTVIWDAADGPYTICQDFILAAGATLQLDPGAVVDFPNSRRLYVDGSLIVNGTAAQPVIITGDNVSGLFVKGSVSFSHADVATSIQLNAGGEAFIADSVLREEAWLSGAADTALFMERCTIESLVFSGAGASHYDTVHFANPTVPVQLGRIYKVDGVSSVTPIEYTLNCQTRLIENVTITGVPGPAITVGASQTGTADVLVDDSNVLTGNEYPIHIRVGGLHPDSVIPTSGNQHNAVLAPFALGSASDLRSLAALPDVGVPYHFLEHATFNGRVDMPPGLVCRLAPDVSLNLRQNNGWHPQLRGLPDLPIRFERLEPGQPWGALGSTQGVNLWEHVLIDGAVIGVSAGESDIYLRDCEIAQCQWGGKPSGHGIIYGTGNHFWGNAIGVENDTSGAALFSGIKMDGAERPNVFAGNEIAVNNQLGSSGQLADDIHVERNWWGHESGPHETFSNPAGEGDAVAPLVLFQPWETQPPDQTNYRPVVRLTTRLHPVALTGDKILLEWEAFDDDGITGFDIDVRTPPTFTDPPGWQTLAWNLPPWTRRYELTVPDREYGDGKQVQFRIVAYEASGQTGLEFFWLNIPDQPPPGTVEFHNDLTQGFLYHGLFTFCYSVLNADSPPTLYIELDGDMRTMREFDPTWAADECTSGPSRMPMASTDTARFAIRTQGNVNNDYWYFSDYFEIRPDPRFEDAPPVVSIISPQPVELFSGGSVIPISWSASDDDFVREYRIQASFNGGYTYHTIADSVPGNRSNYDWRLPTSDGLPEVRIRVVAIDKRFQNSSDLVAVPIAPGFEAQPGDVNADGFIDMTDAALFVDVLTGADQDPGHIARSDTNGDGAANGADVQWLVDALLP